MYQQQIYYNTLQYKTLITFIYFTEDSYNEFKKNLSWYKIIQSIRISLTATTNKNKLAFLTALPTQDIWHN